MIQVAAHDYIRRETAVSIVINSGLSLLFFLAVFGWTTEVVTVWGAGNYAFDFVPQSFMIALMSTLVPGFLTVRAVTAGRVERLPGSTWLPANLALRALIIAVGSAAIGAGLVAGILGLVAAENLPWSVALSAKLLYGAALAWLVTPFGLRAALKLA